ncbi:MAG: adenosylcobinamide-GDP ribazoletransferase, partial [Anaerovoracaceae bacterium]|nr:adenosylcobinamide-GDP ribazoletransferase [Anaerovoracaceae bacterium]
VMTKEPMKESQYSVKTDGKPCAPVVLALTVTAAVFAAEGMDALSAAYLAGLIVVMRIVSAAAGRCARKSLGGMNGDISGFMIVLSEAAAFIYIAAVL